MTVRMIKNVRWSRKSWNGYLKLHVWRLQPATHNLGGLWSSQIRNWLKKAGKAAAGLGMNKFAKDAPVHILVVEESMNITSFLGAKIKDKYFPLIDIGIATAHITLAAESEGLGSCILAGSMKRRLRSLPAFLPINVCCSISR